MKYEEIEVEIVGDLSKVSTIWTQMLIDVYFKYPELFNKDKKIEEKHNDN